MFDDYGLKYPDLVKEIILFFSFNRKGITNATLNEKRSILDFCVHTGVENCGGTEFIYNISIINQICQKLVDLNILMETHKEIIPMGPDFGASHYYITNLKMENITNPQLLLYINSQIFGFEYIYNYYKGIIKPLVSEINGKLVMETAFEVFGGIFTVKHCIENNRNIMIQGYKGTDLNKINIYIYQNSKIDVAFIDLKNYNDNIYIIEDGKVLQEVIVMGYPKVPTFHDFLTVEKANISSINSRKTTFQGNIVGHGIQYLSNSKKVLISAKVAPGNSGSPVINSNSAIVGIVSENVESQDAYDFVGYGVCETSKVMLEIASNKNNILNKNCYNFVDWKY